MRSRRVMRFETAAAAAARLSARDVRELAKICGACAAGMCMCRCRERSGRGRKREHGIKGLPLTMKLVSSVNRVSCSGFLGLSGSAGKGTETFSLCTESSRLEARISVKEIILHLSPRGF